MRPYSIGNRGSGTGSCQGPCRSSRQTFYLAPLYVDAWPEEAVKGRFPGSHFNITRPRICLSLGNGGRPSLAGVVGQLQPVGQLVHRGGDGRVHSLGPSPGTQLLSCLGPQPGSERHPV